MLVCSAQFVLIVTEELAFCFSQLTCGRTWTIWMWTLGQAIYGSEHIQLTIDQGYIRWTLSKTLRRLRLRLFLIL